MKNKAIALLLAAAAAAPAAFAQSDYPAKPIKLIAPYAPGGSVDVLARTLATHLSTELKQSVVVENRPGANTMIAASAVARSPADGYTLLLASNASMVLNPLLYKKLSYNPDKELRLTNILAEAPLVLVTNSQTGIRTVADLKAYARTHAGQLNYSSVGLGNPLQLTTELIKARLDVAATHIPFNGSAPALTALMANDTQLMVDVAGTSLPHIKAGKLVAIATTGPERSQFLPQTPTVAESGVPGFKASTWFGIALPAGTPAQARSTLQSAVNKVLLDPGFARALGQQTLAARQPQTQAQLDEFLASDSQMWRKVITDNNISLDN
ncbi:Argininosuccinate lyase [Delftia tsuruhatensis]|uniref:Bug family tripartite tricarboxylate transporter substrate binding protein n=1 Tax=Delftia tsuruhatensis TaxID=180282 RepID=UPI001E7D7F5D|nr:tripartite tricarboxylate transporter substrate binding protein [Delftia tsuruhatensis]CAB5722904.1 Argininosuccinate lyase [Delftia tsuruhatensis]CAC9682541.1 Argininosuccinate lyase [Delftia tsuruhatensis]